MRVVDLTAGLNLREIDALLASDDIEQTVEKTVRGIIDDVRRRGDEAVCEYTRRFDEFDLTPELMRVPEEHIRGYAADADDDGVLDISDPIRTLQFLFLGGPPLPGPSKPGGQDPTPDDPLGCLIRR